MPMISGWILGLPYMCAMIDLCFIFYKEEEDDNYILYSYTFSKVIISRASLMVYKFVHHSITFLSMIYIFLLIIDYGNKHNSFYIQSFTQ